MSDLNRGNSRASSVEIRATPPDNPRSSAVNYDRPAPISHEEEILELMKAGNAVIAPRSKLILGKYKCDRDEIIADLVDFEVYRCLASGQRYHSELIGLNLFDVKAKDVYFDGYVVANNTRYYVERIKVEDISIGGYGSDSDPSITTYIQTPLAAKDHTSDIWLRLRQPAERYERFHTPFLWIAMLSKYAIDYMDDQPNGTVGLQSFKNSFHSWLSQRFGWNGRVQKWLAMFENKIDFRVAFHAYKDFLYNQALNLSTSQHLASHPVWSQCMCSRLVTIEQRPTLLNYTIATAHVYENFKNMYFARKLRQVPLSASVDQLRRKRSLRLGFSEDGLPPTTIRHRHNDTAESLSVKVGDVVSIIPDDADGIRWRTSGTEWLAYIQGIEPIASGAHRLMVLWLYRPADTNICLANYPITREIFLSDNCNCEERDLLSTDVLRKHTVEWKPKSLITTKDFLIRQTYATSDSAFVTLKDDHKVCPCRKPKPDLVKWCAGDTFYVTKMVAGLKILEPVVIQDIDQKSNTARVRLLLRLARDCSGLSIQAGRNNILPNELVLTGKLKTFSLLRIQRACYVRFVQKTDIINNHVPSPYNLGGVGDFWFISMGLESTNEDKQLIFLERLPRGFHEAQEERLPYAKLRGLSLFGGGGGLDRGIEAAGAVEFDTSVDYDPAAIHTQQANCKDPQSMRLFCGSVDDYLNAAFSGDRDRSIARVGEVDMIAAGSPCPGFSALQQNFLSEQSITYASHITTFCTAVDVYRPLYGILENVVNMASTRTNLGKDQNVLSQLVACLVSMGYQVNQYIMDSWTYGSCRRRSRIILAIAAPGLEPISQKPHTHSRSYEETEGRCLGKLPNGEQFGGREHYATPFPYVSAQKATKDLPDIGNGNIQTCVQFPDHRLSRPTSNRDRKLLECIPVHPPGSGYTRAVQLGLIPPALCSTKKELKRSYQRIRADGLIPTITTASCMQDSRNGASVHWREHRPLSIHEARRSQGIPDEEPIIGTLSQQWKTIGNGVDRKVSLSIGLALRNAFSRSRRMFSTSGALRVEAEVEMIVDAEDDPIPRLSTETDLTATKFPQKTRSSSLATSSTHALLSAASSNRQSKVETDAAIDGFLMAWPSRTVAAGVRRLSLPTISAPLRSNQLAAPKKRSREEAHGPGDASDIAGAVKRAKVVQKRRTSFPTVSTAKLETKDNGKWASAPPLEVPTRTRRSGPAEYAPKAWNRKIGISDNIVKLP